LDELSMKILVPVLFFVLGASLHAQQIPEQLWGTWTVTRTLPAHTISCWGEKEARALIGTRIEYSADLFRWKSEQVINPKVEVRVFTAQQYHDTYSSPSSNGSQVSFAQLGIHAQQIEEVDIKHPAADVTGGTIEIPGDTVLLKGKSSIILSVCNLYFEAHRTADSPGA
jgi:hypothetical protein